jgi:HEAT repeat protein
VQIGEPAIQALLQVINHENPIVREGAVEALGELKVTDPKIIQTVASLLTDKVEKVRGKAADALRNIGKDAIPAMINSYASVNTKMKILILSAIGGIGQDAEAALPHVIANLKEGGTKVRTEAARSLGKIGLIEESVILALQEAFVDSEDSECYSHIVECIE